MYLRYLRPSRVEGRDIAAGEKIEVTNKNVAIEAIGYKIAEEVDAAEVEDGVSDKDEKPSKKSK
jgi:hypothetical protein